VNDGNTGYPWSTGDVLLAADLNAAIANAAAIGTAAVGDTVSSDVHQAVGDYTTLAGPVSWSGVTVNIAGANFAPGDVGKYLIMPAGGTDPLDPVSQPAIVRITSANGTTANVDHTVAHAFSGLTNIVGGPNSTPWNIDVAAPGAGGSFIGDVLTLVAPAIRPAAVQVIQTQVLSATVVNSGSGGPVGAVLLRGTTGYGRRVVLSGTVDATGTLLPALTLDPATGADPGAYWFDVEDANVEPLRADPQKITYPARWNTIDPVITLDSGQVSSLVMPSIHAGALVFAVDDNNVVAYPPRTTVTHVDGPSLTATLSATATVGYGNSGPRNVDFNDNKHELTFPATFANNSTTIVATGTLPTGVVVGQLIYGPGLTGGNDPTDPAAGSTIQTIAGTTITISRPTTHAATAAVTLNTVPYLTGAVVKLNLVPAVLAFKDYGAYAGAPGSSGVPFATTRAGASTDITLLIDNPVRTTPVAVSFGTDNTSQINAWLADARNLMNANGGGIEAILRPGQYLALGSINARNLNQNGVTLRVSGVRIHSAAKGLRAWDASGAAAYRMVGDFVLNGDQLFPPDTGMVFAYSDTYLRCNGLSLRDITCTGWFSFASVICANAESFHVINMQSGNAMPWPVPVAPTDPNWHPTFGKVIDGDNSYNKLDAPAYQTHASFVGFLEDNGSSNCNGGAIPFSVVGCGGYTNRAGYAASWSAPAIFFSKTGHSILDIHCEVETLTDIVFLWDRNNGVVQFNNSRFDDNACEATNSVFSYDHFGKFGVHVAGFSGINSRVSVGLQHNSAQPFDDHSAFAGSHIWHGDIAVGGVLHTQTPHWVRNFPDDREGLLLLGDDKTNYNADAVNTSTLIVGNTIQANGDITSEAGLVNAALGVVIGVPGFPQGKLTFDGTNLSGTKPISLPAGSIAITPAPGDSSTSVATTAFVQAAASASLTYTATEGTTPRAAKDRAGEVKNVLDFGATLNGVASDSAGIGAALAQLNLNQSLVIPSGISSITWGGVQNSIPAGPVHYVVDGVTAVGATFTGTGSGTSLTVSSVVGTISIGATIQGPGVPNDTTIVSGSGTSWVTSRVTTASAAALVSTGLPLAQNFNRVGKGDLFETFSAGTKQLITRSGKADAGGVLRIEHNQTAAGGTAGFVNNVLNIVCQDNTAAVTSMWGVNVSMDTYSNQAGWPQNVGGSFSQHKHGKAWAAGAHITADDDQNLPSSAGGPLLGLEMGFRANNVDDGFSGGVTGGIGIRMGLHLSLYEYGGTGAVLPGEISFGILADGSANSITKSILAVSTDMNTYQVVDARGALPPSGYTSPVAAVRMSAGQIVDFNGGAALNSAAGAYLQYRTATGRLYYVVAGVDQWSVDASGNVRARGTVTGSTTP
jgi:hypothetical protein